MYSTLFNVSYLQGNNFLMNKSLGKSRQIHLSMSKEKDRKQRLMYARNKQLYPSNMTSTYEEEIVVSAATFVAQKTIRLMLSEFDSLRARRFAWGSSLRSS